MGLGLGYLGDGYGVFEVWGFSIIEGGFLLVGVLWMVEGGGGSGSAPLMTMYEDTDCSGDLG